MNPSRYTEAIAFALNTPAARSRELYSPLLHLRRMALAKLVKLVEMESKSEKKA